MCINICILTTTYMHVGTYDLMELRPLCANDEIIPPKNHSQRIEGLPC